MRKPGFCLALAAIAATASLVTLTTPASADEDSPADSVKPPKPAADGTVRVHINSVLPVTLMHRSGKDGAWQTACIAPCNQSLPVADEYQVVTPGGDTPPSHPFFLRARGDKVILEVAPGEKSKAATGTILLVSGVVIAVAGAIIATAFALETPYVSGNGDSVSHNGRVTGMWVGGAMVFGGLGLGVYGLGTKLANEKTLVGGDLQADQPARGNADPVVRAAQHKPSVFVPIFSAHF